MSWAAFREKLTDEQLKWEFDDLFAEDEHEKIELFLFLSVLHLTLDNLPEKDVAKQADLGHIIIVETIMKMVSVFKLNPLLDKLNVDEMLSCVWGYISDRRAH